MYNDNEQPLVTEADELKTYGDYTFNRLHSPDPQKENNSQPSDYDSKHEDDIKKSRIDQLNTDQSDEINKQKTNNNNYVQS